MNRLLALMLFVVSAHAGAMTFTTPSKTDSRFQTVKYTTDIVRVYVKEGAFFELVLAPDEAIVDFTMGDNDGWIKRKKDNSFYLKPKAKFASTPLKVWSAKREYWFDLSTEEPPERKKPWALQLKIEYPWEPPKPPEPISPALLAAQAAAQQKLDVESRLGRAANPQAADQPVGRTLLAERQEPNGNYGIIGPEELTPTSVYDNGELTAITFAPNNPMPRVFVKEADGSESRVPFHIENDMLIVHRVARKLVLRRGEAVACLINGSFNPSGPNSNTNTVSDDVVREMRRND